MHFAKYAEHVTMLVRGESLTKSMSQYLIDQIESMPNITVRPYCSVVEVDGATSLEKIVIADSRQGTQETVPATSLFIFIGAMPQPTGWAAS